MTDRLTTTCRELIDIESVSKNEAAIESHIRSALPGELETKYDEDTVLYVTTPRRDNHQLVVLAGHTDTVPVEDNLPSRLEDGIVHGRGASDMKAGLAVMLELARTVHEQPTQLPFDLGFIFFGREELPADECPLLDALKQPAFAGIDMAILMEPTSNAIEAGCMGNLNLKVTFHGKSAHSARPWQGENAAHKAISALSELAQRTPRRVHIEGLEFSEVANVTKLVGGDALNVIPNRADFFVNVRYTPDNEPDDAERSWREYFELRGGEVEVIGNARSAPVVTDHPLIKRLKDSGVNRIGAKQAWTNAADFAAIGVPAVNFGPGDPRFAHQRDEQVGVVDLHTSFDILQKFLR